MIMVYKTLLSFASKGGATKETSEIIADVLREKFGLKLTFLISERILETL